MQYTPSFNVGNPISGSFGYWGEHATQKGSLLICTVAVIGTSAPAWNSGAHYVAGNLVTLGSSGVVYQCILANTNETPPNVTYWTSLGVAAPPTINLPSTPGFTWVLAGTASNPVPSIQSGETIFLTETVAIFYIDNAASMGAAVQTTLTAVPSPSGSIDDFGFQLIEVAGMALTGVVDSVVSGYGVQPATATAGNIVTTTRDFILVFVTDPNFNTEFQSGTGWILMPTGGVGSGYGDNQYIVSAYPGTYDTSFSSTAETYGPWVVLAVAFKGAAS